MTTKTTIEHNGTHFTVTFDGEANTSLPRWSATVSYPSIEDGGPDLSAMPSALAYPTAEIEAFVSSHVGRPVIFDDCAHAGCDASAWESWRFRADDAWPTRGKMTTVRREKVAAVVAGLLDALDAMDAAPPAPPRAAGGE